MQKAFRNVLVIAIIGVILFGVFNYINNNGTCQSNLHIRNLLNSWIKVN